MVFIAKWAGMKVGRPMLEVGQPMVLVGRPCASVGRPLLRGEAAEEEMRAFTLGRPTLVRCRVTG